MATDLVKFQYRNHRGEVAERHVRPIRIWFGSTAWHQEAQWMMECFDIDKQATRDYSMSGVLGPWQHYHWTERYDNTKDKRSSEKGGEIAEGK